MRRLLILGSILAVFMVSSPATASERHGHFVLSVGVMDAQVFHDGGERSHLGSYTTFDLRYGRHISQNWAIIAGGGIDWAPQDNKWGISGSVTFEWRMFERVRFDINIVFMHDQDGHAEFFAGGGPGLTFLVTKRILVELSLPWLACLKSPSGALFAPSLSIAWRF